MRVLPEGATYLLIEATPCVTLEVGIVTGNVVVSDSHTNQKVCQECVREKECLHVYIYIYSQTSHRISI